MNIEDIARRLDATSSGAGFKAHCPAHDDHTASLSINEKDGKILLNCFAGCDTEAVLRAVGLMMKDLFVDSNATVISGPPSSPPTSIAI